VHHTELARLDATAQADLVRAGAVTPTEFVEAAIRAVELLDPQLDAVFVRTFEHALEHARAAPRDAPFPGVPILVKDIALELEGYPYGHGGLRLLRERGHVSDRTTHLAAALRGAGFAFLGRSTSALQGVELGASDLALHTMPRNPWSTAHATGGSSSGSAAAVAAGLVPLAHGNDGGGSLRMPAALCGLVGLKPSRGRVSPGPLISAVASVAHAWVEEFVLTRTVRDTAAVLPLLSGRGPGDPFAPLDAPRTTAGGRRLRIGVTTTPFSVVPGLGTDPAVARVATGTADLLAELGHTAVPVDPPRYDLLAHDWQYGISGPAPTMLARDLDVVARIVGRPLTPQDVGPLLWTLSEQGRSFSALQALEFAEFVQRTCVAVDRWWDEQDLDLLLTPTVARRVPPMTDYLPPPAGDYAVSLDDPLSTAYALAALLPLVCFTQLFNWTGQPAVSLPLGVDDDGLPVGVQLAARRLREDQLLDVAAELEAARPWAGRTPVVHAGAASPAAAGGGGA
jgi:amidase